MDCGAGSISGPGAGGELGTASDPSRYSARHARRASLPLVVRGIAPAATILTSATGRPCAMRATAALIAAATGCGSSRPPRGPFGDDHEAFVGITGVRPDPGSTLAGTAKAADIAGADDPTFPPRSPRCPADSGCGRRG